MDSNFNPGASPEEIKEFLRAFGLIPRNEYYDQLKRIIKRRRQSPKTITEQIQRKLTENGIHKDELSKSMPILCPRKRASFSPVITRKRGKAIKKRTPSATQMTNSTVTVVKSETSPIVNSVESTSKSSGTPDCDQPLDLRLQAKSTN